MTDVDLNHNDAARFHEGMRIEFWQGSPRWWRHPIQWVRYWWRKWRDRNKPPEYYVIESVEVEDGVE